MIKDNIEMYKRILKLQEEGNNNSQIAELLGFSSRKNVFAFIEDYEHTYMAIIRFENESKTEITVNRSLGSFVYKYYINEYERRDQYLNRVTHRCTINDMYNKNIILGGNGNRQKTIQFILECLRNEGIDVSRFEEIYSDYIENTDYKILNLGGINLDSKAILE